MLRRVGLVLLLSFSLFGTPSVAGGWRFEAALASPTAREIRAVDISWRTKPRKIRLTETIEEPKLSLAGTRYDVRAFRFTLNGSPRCGMILLPEGRPAKVPMLIDVPDVRWDYPPRDISRRLYVTGILGRYSREVALALPCLRGNVLKTATLTLEAGGSRSDAWEGAADDVIAFLTVVLRNVPEVDPRRLVIYGSSRGGGVALLAAQRDRRIRAALALAPPTDWFSEMGRPGTDWAAALDSARFQPVIARDSREAQFFDWFVNGAPALGAVRRRLLAASPAYFVNRLPPTLVLQGEKDTAVPPGNARRLLEMVAAAPVPTRVEVKIVAGEGHVIRDPHALVNATEFLKARLSLPQRPGDGQ